MAIFWKPSVQLELYHHGVKGQKVSWTTVPGTKYKVREPK